jgi:hypothetical protein
MIPKTRRQWIVYIALLIGGVLLIWLIQAEANSPIKSMLRHFIKAVTRAF